MKNNMGDSNIVSMDNEKSPITEAYRTLRTNIQFAGIGNKLNTLLITSPESGDGKSTTAANLAVVMAQANKRVLLIDGDLRKPSQNFLFNTPNRLGLTDLLIGNARIHEVIIPIIDHNLQLLPAGRIPPNPSELLSCEEMSNILRELKKHFDYILIDAPPILPVTDAQLLSRAVDGVLLVVNYKKTSSERAKKAKGLIEIVGGKIIGTVLNKKKMKYTEYYL